MTRTTTFYILLACFAFTNLAKAGTLINDKEKLNEEHVMNSIEYIEDEEEVDLGFDVTHYLPYLFDPYKGMIFNISEIEYLEIPEPIDLGFNISEYLPQDFNPHKKWNL